MFFRDLPEYFLESTLKQIKLVKKPTVNVFRRKAKRLSASSSAPTNTSYRRHKKEIQTHVSPHIFCLFNKKNETIII